MKSTLIKRTPWTLLILFSALALSACSSSNGAPGIQLDDSLEGCATVNRACYSIFLIDDDPNALDLLTYSGAADDIIAQIAFVAQEQGNRIELVLGGSQGAYLHIVGKSFMLSWADIEFYAHEGILETRVVARMYLDLGQSKRILDDILNGLLEG